MLCTVCFAKSRQFYWTKCSKCLVSSRTHFFSKLLTQAEIYSLVHSSYRMGCFLCIGLTFAHFRLSGKIPVAIATFAHIHSSSDAWSNFFHGEIWWLFIFFEEKWFKFSGFTTYPIINFLSESFGYLI